MRNLSDQGMIPHRRAGGKEENRTEQRTHVKALDAALNAENALCPFVIGHRNFLFAGHPNGANAAASVYSLIETTRACGLDPYRNAYADISSVLVLLHLEKSSFCRGP